MKKDLNLREELSRFKLTSAYLRTKEDGKKETWDDAVDRVMNMHAKKYANIIATQPELAGLIEKATKSYKKKLILGSQRGLQFGGDQIFKHNVRLYNCATSYCDRVEVFREILYVLLCGAGAGISVQYHHVNKLPLIQTRDENNTKTYVIPDSIEGWADALGVLIASYTRQDEKFKEYWGVQIRFDYSLIRPKGAKISGGFKAPGPDGLKAALEKIESLLQARLIASGTPYRLKPIDCYDVICHSSDAVLSGGVRRSALIILFSKTDEEMLNAKTGNWFVNNKQRARSNNSVVLLKNEVTEQEFNYIFEKVKQFGEPGFVFLDSTEHLFNPCVEAGMMPKLILQNGQELSGWQFCNLNEINGAQCTTEEIFYEACETAAILGTLQAGWTDFSPYLTTVTEEIVAKEALLGVSITGMCNNPDILFNAEMQKRGATIVKETNIKVAALLGINPAARTTNIKPSGNSSVVLGSASGVHGEHSRMYFRNVQVNKQEYLGEVLKGYNPSMFEESVWSANKTDWAVSFPIIAPEQSLFKEDLMGVKQLELVKLTQQNWVEYGTNLDACVDKTLRHNVSNTINVDDWDAVGQYIYENRHYFAGISLLSASGDKDYAQAPFTSVYTPKQLMKEYGDAVMFASGLIVDGLAAFNNNLWAACDTVLGWGEKLEYTKEEIQAEIEKFESKDLWERLGIRGKALRILVKSGEKPTIEEYGSFMNERFRDTVYNYTLKKDWVRRFKKFARNYLDNDMKRTSYCLKDVQNWHKWCKITMEYEPIDYEHLEWAEEFIDVDSLAGQACSGGQCEIITV
jgi:ribonucleoside-triphosphate reductase